MHVLIVEDEPTIVESLRFVLSRAGYQVDSTGDGVKALDAVQNHPPDVIILDVMLPERNGFEVLKWLKQHARFNTIPVLMLTAKGQPQDRDTALQLGADEFMTKPFSNKDVIACVGRLCAAKQ